MFAENSYDISCTSRINSHGQNPIAASQILLTTASTPLLSTYHCNHLLSKNNMSTTIFIKLIASSEYPFVIYPPLKPSYFFRSVRLVVNHYIRVKAIVSQPIHSV